MSKEFYRAEDLAKKLDVNIMTIYRYIKAGKIKAYKIGKEFRIDKTGFKSFLKKVSTK
jgi:putative resolvase